MTEMTSAATKKRRNKLLRMIPAVDEVLNSPEISKLQGTYPRETLRYAVQQIIQAKRSHLLQVMDSEEINTSEIKIIDPAQIDAFIARRKECSLKRVINATGIIIHTNIGRAPLSENAVNAVMNAAKYYTNLEFDLLTGKRGDRYSHVTGLLQEITGAESGLVVNNNAAAVLLCLATLAKGYEVIVSRGELIEIGGSFRIPEILEQSGARLIEIGSTNRTHLKDYENALNSQTRLILKVHTSNYRVVGFTSEVTLSELSRLAAKHELPLLYDMGSGNFLPSRISGLKDEPTVQEEVANGADILTFSGDKLLGGPQAGIIVGKRRYLDRLKKNPLNRAIRIDKMTLAALEATLKTYAPGQENSVFLPAVQMLIKSPDELKQQADILIRNLNEHCPAVNAEIVKDVSQVGGGAYPLYNIPTYAVSVDPFPLSASQFERKLRFLEIPVIARIKNDRILFDLRTLNDEDLSLLPNLLADLVKNDR